MLTEPQFKVLTILFDDEGHSGWELAKKLGVKESNLNPYLKNLEERKFIFQGTPRRSTKPKKRDGDYKEIPYYLTTDLEILGTIFEEMTVTNRNYDTGFPYRHIIRSKYIKSLKINNIDNINKFLIDLSRKLQFDDKVRCSIIKNNIKHFINIDIDRPYAVKILHFNNISRRDSRIRKRRVTKRLMGELARWWDLYSLRKCCSQNPVDIEELEMILFDDALKGYILGEDILDLIFNAIEKMPNYEDLDLWRYLNDMLTMLREMPNDIEKKEYFL